jgi:hypothetical protein
VAERRIHAAANPRHLILPDQSGVPVETKWLVFLPYQRLSDAVTHFESLTNPPVSS